MELTKNKILNRINRLQVSFRVTWEDIEDDLDMAIDKINDWLGTKYPPVTKILNEHAPEDKTYSYRAGGKDVEFFPNKYFMNIVIPFVVTQILARDEEFTAIYSKYLSDIDENLLLMTAQEINNVPYHLIDSPKGVYFQNPEPKFKKDPEGYFNRKIFKDVPRIKVFYNWNIDFEHVQGFVDKPLPVDNNSYERGYSYMPSILGTNNYIPMLVDDKATVLAVFLGWSLTPEGEVLTNEPITLNEDVTLYGQWDYDIIRFRYEGNGGTLANWKPMYVNKNDIPPEGITPTAGTAVRRGYNFIGFDPIKITPEFLELQEEEIENDGMFEDWELEQINETEKEPDVTFTAQWERVDYKITFLDLKPGWESPQEGLTYRYGEEIEILPPTPPGAAKDEFIGWWDNRQFLGDPITKITESDYGDKVFYANMHSVSYRVDFIDEDGSLLKTSLLYKGDIIVAPPNQPTRVRTVLDDSEARGEYTREFDGYKDYIDGTNFEENMIVTKPRIFVATYKAEVRTEVPLTIHIKKDDEVPNQILTNVFKYRYYNYLELYNLLGENNSYEDGGLTYKVNKFAFTDSMVELPSSVSFVENTNEISALYTNELISVTFQKVIWDEIQQGLIIDDPVSEVLYVANQTIKGQEFLKTQIPLEIDLTIIPGGVIPTFYFDKFLILNNDNSTSEFEDVFPDGVFDYDKEQSIVVIPTYKNDVNPENKRTITFIGLPNQSSDGIQEPVVITYDLNQIVNLKTFKSINYNDLHFRNIEENEGSLLKGFYKDSSYTTPETEQVIMNTDKIIYVKTFSELRINFYLYLFWAPGGASTLVKRFYRKDLIPITTEGVVKINPTLYQGSANLNPIDNTKFFDGWNKLEGQEITEPEYIISIGNMMEQQISPISLQMFPVYKTKKGFKINIDLIYTQDNISKPTQASFQTLVFEYDVTHQNTNKQFTINNIAEEFAKNNGKSGSSISIKNEGLISGYQIKGYKVGSGSWRSESEFPISVNLGGANNDTIKEFNNTVYMEARSNYILAKDVGISAGMYKPGEYKYRNFFFPSGKTWKQLSDEGRIPWLIAGRELRGNISGYYYSDNPNQAINSGELLLSDRDTLLMPPSVGNVYCKLDPVNEEYWIYAEIINNNNKDLRITLDDGDSEYIVNASTTKTIILEPAFWDPLEPVNPPIIVQYYIGFRNNGDFSMRTFLNRTIEVCTI